MSLKYYWKWFVLNFMIFLADIINLYKWKFVGSWKVYYEDGGMKHIVKFYECEKYGLRKAVPDIHFIFLFFRTLELYFKWQIKLYSLEELNEYMVQVEEDELV